MRGRRALLLQLVQALVDGGSLRADDLGQRTARKAHSERAIPERRGEGAKRSDGQVVNGVEHQETGVKNSAPRASTVGTTSARSRNSFRCSQEVSAMSK